MTATDSSHIEPDIHDSETEPTQHATTARPGEPSISSTDQRIRSFIAYSCVSDARHQPHCERRSRNSPEEASEERRGLLEWPRAPGWWRVCTGLAGISAGR
jgi:hypothetical protein